MTSSPGLRGWSRLQSNYSLPWSVTDDDRWRSQTPESKRAKQYWPLHNV